MLRCSQRSGNAPMLTMLWQGSTFSHGLPAYLIFLCMLPPSSSMPSGVLGWEVLFKMPWSESISQSRAPCIAQALFC
eukprot:1159381-Pelagomonas_calceolata.AAC.8